MKCIKSVLGSMAFLLWSVDAAMAWGPIGHKVVGGLAIDALDQDVRNRLSELMGTDDLEQLTDWCNWPDEYRATDQGAWSSPLHYVNIPEGSDTYEATRDCRQDLCVTKAIPGYAQELSDLTLDREQRQRAFGFVCHFVGDLSQSLHAGFGHDRGGNDFPIRFQGEELNLHEFWDSVLIELHTDHWSQLFRSLRDAEPGLDSRNWSPAMVIDWTNESHHIAASRAYPAGPEISTEFAEQSWEMIQQQLQKGGRNLALVLNSVLASRCRHDEPHRDQ